MMKPIRMFFLLAVLLYYPGPVSAQDDILDRLGEIAIIDQKAYQYVRRGYAM